MARQEEITQLAQGIGDDIQQLKCFSQQIAGQFLLDPNEVNGWGVQGFVDNSNTQDWGNSNSSQTLSPNTMGGFMFPFDVKLKRIYAVHDNSNVAAEAWGWVVYTQSFTFDSNTEVTAVVLDETASGTGPRNYLDSDRQLTDITTTTNNSGSTEFISDVIIPAGNMIGLGVSAPTAVATNYYVRVHGGYMEFERILT